MKALRIRPQQTVADPLQSERLLTALTIILEHQEDRKGRSMLRSSLDQSATTRRHPRESTALAQAPHSAPRVGAAARACIYR
jgi:hypothetical protein